MRHLEKIGALFDLDGVLLDTEGSYSEFWASMDRLYPTGVKDFANVIKGSNLSHILNTYFPGEALGREVTRRLDEFQANMEYRFFDGALEWLDTLAAAGVPLCLVTSSDSRKMDAVYRSHPTFKQRFKAIVTGDMVKHPKPDSDCFVLGAQLIGCEASECVVFEDSINGLRAGRGSGALVVGVATTCDRREVEPLCDIAVDTIADITVAQILQQ